MMVLDFIWLFTVEEYSRYIWHFPMARKSNVILLPCVLNMLETQFQTHVKIIRSDGVVEFANHLLKNYFASTGILHQLFCPGTPKQNGLAK